MKRTLFTPPVLYPILDAAMLPPEPGARRAMLHWIITQLFTAGATLLQYRNKRGSDAQILADCAILHATASTLPPAQRPTLMLNDRPDLVAATNFDGAHIGQQDISPAEARTLIGHRILGLSTHNEPQLLQANQTSADYIAIGPVFATTTKENPDPVVGLEGVRRARALTTKPLVAIGGITLANCRSVRDAGADSVAVISSLFGGLSNDPSGGLIEKTARDFFAKLR